MSYPGPSTDPADAARIVSVQQALPGTIEHLKSGNWFAFMQHQIAMKQTMDGMNFAIRKSIADGDLEAWLNGMATFAPATDVA